MTASPSPGSPDSPGSTGSHGSPAWPRPVRIDALSVEDRASILTRAAPDDRDIEDRVRQIIDTVRSGGDDALLTLTERFDEVRPGRLVLGPDDFRAAFDAMAPDLRRAVERAARNLERVAQATRDDRLHAIEVEPGLTVEEFEIPLHRVGAYVPGGKASYPSSVLMAAVPARAAGVREVIVASPPGRDGRPPAAVLAACHVAGVDACLVAGGAQAIAALAYGTESVPAVDKIVGPGNRYVTAAKRAVYGEVDIDSPAGPTEVLILADGDADPDWVALDLVAQAEHSEDARCLLVTTYEALADVVAARLPEHAARAERRDIVTAALQRHGHILVARDREEATAFANAYAPEHLQVMTTDPRAWSDAVPNAATTFLDMYAPVPVGDYLTGANHVLPTGRAARWAAPLSVHTFRVRRTRQRLTREAAVALADDLDVFARAEGLPGHAAAARARKEVAP